MKILIAFSLILISCAAQIRPPIPNSVLAPTPRLFTPFIISETCSGKNDTGKWKCADCRTVQQCSETTKPSKTISCADQYPGRPYCDSTVSDISKKCVTNPKVCNQDTSKFICPNTGSYPSLVNCKEYYWCKKEKADGVKYICKYNSNYNHEKKACITNSVCYTVTADCGKKFKIIPYKLDNNLYVTCRGESPPKLDQCENNKGWDQNLIKCDFVCKEEGTFPSPDDKKSYYICTLNGRNLEKEKIDCAKGEEFNPDLKHCLPADDDNTTLNPTSSTPESNEE